MFKVVVLHSVLLLTYDTGSWPLVWLGYSSAIWWGKNCASIDWPTLTRIFDAVWLCASRPDPISSLFIFSLAERKNEQQKEDKVPQIVQLSGRSPEMCVGVCVNGTSLLIGKLGGVRRAVLRQWAEQRAADPAFCSRRHMFGIAIRRAHRDTHGDPATAG